MAADLSGSSGTGSEAISLPLYNTQGALQPEELPNDIDILKLWYHKREPVRDKIRRFRDAIRSHTDEGGNPHDIARMNGAVNPKLLSAWQMGVQFGPYMEYLQTISKKLRYLEYLLHWMLVSCSPSKWKFLKSYPHHRDQRVARTNVSIIDYNSSGSMTASRFRDCQGLHKALSATCHDTDVRLIVVEDLSRYVVETLGSQFQIDPVFFLSHISGYLPQNDPYHYVAPPDINMTAQQRSHLSVEFPRARWFANEAEFDAAEFESGRFNVLRRLDSDRSRKGLQSDFFGRGSSVSLGSGKISFWWKGAAQGEPVTGLVLVDPTVSTGTLLWGGRGLFELSPSIDTIRSMGEHALPDPTSSLFEEAVYWSCRLSKDDLITVKNDPRALVMPMLKVVVAEWLSAFKYMSNMVGVVDRSLDTPKWGKKPTDYDGLLQKMRPWRRNMHHYQWMIKDAFTILFSHGTETPHRPPTAAYVGQLHKRGLQGLRHDFEQLKERIDYLQMRIERLWDTSSNALAAEDSRRAFRANQNNAGQVLISILATIFLPLNFATSFLSMSSDFSIRNTTFWLFFAINFPLLGLTALIVVVAFPAWRDSIRRTLGTLFQRMRKEL